MKIVGIPYSELLPLVQHIPKSTQLLFPKTARYYVVRTIEGEFVGCCGIQYFKEGSELKADWTEPKFRGQGVHKTMLEFRLKLIAGQGLKYAVARCTSMSLGNYLKAGFVVTKELKTLTEVKKELNVQ